MSISIRKYLPVLLVMTLLSCKQQGEKSSTIDVENLHLPDVNSLFRDYDALEKTGRYAEFASKLIRENRDLNASELYVEAAGLYHRAGKPDSVAIALHLAIDHGMANPNVLKRLEGLDALPENPSWTSLEKRLDSLQLAVSELDHFGLEMKSMQVFWPYFNRALQDTTNARKIFKEFIFNAPREIRDYYAVRYLNLDNMYGQMINAAPSYYSYLEQRFHPDSLARLKSQTKGWMKNFKAIYPGAVFPKVYVVPGILNSGGTATEMGLFVGGDMYGRSPAMPVEGLTDWQRGAVMEFSAMPGLAVHELMHFQQNYAEFVDNYTVLGGVIGEGVCDFLVELSSGIEMSNSNLDYLREAGNLDFILSELKADMFGTDNSKWIYNGGSIEDRPHDLGYTIGYLICKSYYENQEDKKQAVYELLNTSDMQSILAGSKYAYILEDGKTDMATSK